VNWSFENHPYCAGPAAGQRDICPPREYDGLPDTLYISNQDGTFRDASSEWKLRTDATSKGLGVLIADFDGNGHTDVYVANDTTNNFLYYNTGNSTFEESATTAGVAADKSGIPNGSMGVDLLDFNHNGRIDIWVTNYEREDFALYRNEGQGAFLHVSDIMGLNVLGGLFVGFGTVSADFDLDGKEDILVNNGHVILYPTASPRKQRPVAMHAEDKRFVRATFDDSSYMMEPHDGRGLAVADIDNDGDLDPIFSNMNSPLSILRNNTSEGVNWLQVRLIGTSSNRDAIGAVAIAEVDGKSLQRVRKGGSSYMSTNQETLSWGLGKAKMVNKLEVRWPNGKVSNLSAVPANQLVTIVEPIDE
jgi:hypothetical protein